MTAQEKLDNLRYIRDCSKMSSSDITLMINLYHLLINAGRNFCRSCASSLRPAKKGLSEYLKVHEQRLITEAKNEEQNEG